MAHDPAGGPLLHAISNQPEQALDLIGIYEKKLGSRPKGLFITHKSQPLYYQGQPGEQVYLLKTGRVRLIRFGQDGTKMHLMDLSAGGFFGAFPFQSEESYHDAALVLEPSTFYSVHRERFEAMMEQDGQLALAVTRALVERIKASERRIEALTLRSASARLAAAILGLCPEGDNMVDCVTHQDLADMVAVSRETVTRILSQFEADGIAVPGRARLHILDRSRLELMLEP